MILLIWIWFLQLNLSFQSSSPLIQEIFISKNLAQNQTVRLNCALVEGDLPVKFEWYFNDEKLIENSNRKIKITEDSSDLIIKSLSIDDLGNFKCMASNIIGVDEKNVNVYFNCKYRFCKYNLI